jgi:hypothetical protein
MNDEDQFEKRLQGQSQRPVPPAWREGILSAAREATSRDPSPKGSLLSRLNSMLSTVFWPHPKAWAGLAAIWVLILGLNLATREPSQPEVARQAAPPSPQMREMLQQQEQLFAELVGPIERLETRRPKPVAPQPRSQRREDFVKA